MDQYIKDISKGLVKNKNTQELTPGTGRRYEPAGGVTNHNERIHRESKLADDKNLPFNFRKPLKPLGTPIGIECPHCGKFIGANTKTVAIICSGCKKLFNV